MTSTNDGKDVKSNQTSGPKGKSYYIELYKSLDARLSGDCGLLERTRHLCDAWRQIYSLCQHSAPSTHLHLLSWLQRHTAKTVLQTEWHKSENKDEFHKLLGEAIDDFTRQSRAAASSRDGLSQPWETQLVQRGEWFQRLLASPWGHPTLRVLLDSEAEPPSDHEVLEWLKDERCVMFVTRLRQLAADKHCVDLALLLVSAVMDRVRASEKLNPDAMEDAKDKPNPEVAEPTFANVLKVEAGFTVDVWELLTDIEFVLLHKRDKRARCIELAKQTPLRDGYQLVERLQSRFDTSPRDKKLWKNAKDVAIIIAQVIITRCMVVPVCGGAGRTALYCCARALARLLAAPRLRAAAAALAAPAATARHLHTLAAAVDAQSTPDMKPFVCELYVRAITAGMNELERLKLKTEKCGEAAARAAAALLAAWLRQLGGVLAGSVRVRAECALTAFSLHPSADMLADIRAAPHLPPIDILEPKQEEAPSEFGSWASDSRSQTNFVKTSETLNLKQTQHQANVLSTAILTEGEALGLSPELCQDITVLLSGPRLKTLSWDMDRELLLEKCRTYMERTHGGTRTLTTELKYLNLDPKDFGHLPEEEEDDTDIYYGIEKGYEHLVEQYHEPEEIWQDAEDPERTTSAHSSDIESLVTPKVRRKKKSKKNLLDYDEDLDPLSYVAEAKRTEKKKERPHSKERSKERAKAKTKIPKDPLATDPLSDITTTEIKKDGTQVEIKKEVTKEKKKRERKKKEKKIKSEPMSTSLSSLIGMKISQVGDKIEETKVNPLSITDSDYDSQGKSSLNSEGNDPDVVYDGVFSMDELKSPDRNSDKLGLMRNNELHLSNGAVTVNSHIKKINNIQHSFNNTNNIQNYSLPSPNSVPNQQSQGVPEKLRTVTDDVKKSITRLIQFRRQKALNEQRSLNMSPPINSSPTTPNRDPNIGKIGNAISKPQIPLHTHISPKPVEVPDIPKVYINKKQSEQLAEIKEEMNYLLNIQNSNPRPVIQYAHKTNANIQSPGKILNPTLDTTQDGYLVQNKLLTPMSRVKEIKSRKKVSNVNKDTQNQKTFHDFLHELQKSINAGIDESKPENTVMKKEIRPMNRVTPISPMTIKAETKMSPPCAKQIMQQKKMDALNTFSRLSYMHKNCKTDLKLKQIEAVIEHQDQVINSQLANQLSNIDQVIQEQKHAKFKYLQTNDLIISRVNKSSSKTNDSQLTQKVEKPIASSTRSVVGEHPLISNLLKRSDVSTQNTPVKYENPTSVAPTKYESETKNFKVEPRDSSTPVHNRFSALSEKDQNDLLLLLRQQRKQNATQPRFDNTRNYNIQPPQPSLQCPSASNTQPFKYNSVPCHQLPSKKDTPSHTKNLQNTGIKIPHVIRNTVDVNSQQRPVNMVKTELNCTKNADSTPNMERLKTEIISDNVAKIAKTIAANKETEWESVMNALLSHKTPSRGPNALEMALNKETIDKNYAENILRSHRMMIPNTTEHSVKPIIKDQTKIPTSNPNVNTATNSTANKTTILKRTPKSISKETKIKIGSKSQSQATNAPKNSIKTSEVPLSIANIMRPVKSETPKSQHQLDKRPSQTDYPKKTISSNKKQFSCTLPKEDDPFISGIRNSDYDLLEELMDDDLRQEIGELSDDDTFSAPATVSKDPQNFVVANKDNPAIQHEKRVVTAPVIANRQQTVIKPVQKSKSDNTAKAIDMPVHQTSGFVNTQTKISTADYKVQDNVQATNIVHQVPSNVIVTPNCINNASYMSHQVNQIEQTFVTTMPQQNTLKKVVVLSSEIVYQPCTLQTQIPITNLATNSYVTFNNQPNMALYQTTQFAAPVVSPIIIGNAITMPMSLPIENIQTTSIPKTSEVINNSNNQHQVIEHEINKNVTIEAKSEVSNQVTNKEARQDVEHSTQSHADNKSEKEMFEFNKSCERKVLSEVQEKFGVNEKMDMIMTRSRKLSLDPEVKKDVSKDQERLKKKRMAIINRKIYHRSNNKPIALTYVPLKPSDKEQEKDNTSTITDSSTNSTEKDVHESNQDKNMMSATPVDSSENFKENKSDSLQCRRILLRSSNRLSKANISDVAPSDTSTKIKVRLKPNTTESTGEPKEQCSNDNSLEPDQKIVLNKKTNKKKKILTSKAKCRKTEAKSKPNKVKRNLRVKNQEAHITNHSTDNKAPVSTDAETLTELPELMDIEEQLTGSKIPKNVSPPESATQLCDKDQAVLENASKCEVVPNNSSNNTQPQCVSNEKDTISQETQESSSKVSNQKHDKVDVVSQVTATAKSTDLTEENHTRSTEQVLIPEVSVVPRDIGANNALITARNDVTLNDNEVPKDNVSGTNHSKVDAVNSNHKVSDIKSIPQSYKDSIIIEDMPNAGSDPLKKCVRIKVPSGRIFKATVHSKTNVNFDTLFSDPMIKDLLLSNLTDRKKYMLNVKQVATTTNNESDKIKTRVQEAKLHAASSFPEKMETINLLSDDEEEEPCQYFKTEHGKYKVQTLNKDDVTKHQKRFDQKCCVKLKRENLQQDANTDESNFKQQNELPKSNSNDSHQNIVTCEQPSVVTLTPTIVTSSKQNGPQTVTETHTSITNEPDVIEIDDSSNDSLELKSDSNKSIPAEDKLTELKDLLLKDLGIADPAKAVIPVENKITSTNNLTPDIIKIRNEKDLSNPELGINMRAIEKEVKAIEKLTLDSDEISNKNDNGVVNLDEDAISVEKEVTSTEKLTHDYNKIGYKIDSGVAVPNKDVIAVEKAITSALKLTLNASKISDNIVDLTDETITEPINSLIQTDTCADQLIPKDSPTESSLPKLELPNCYIKLTKCDDLVKMYEQQRIVNKNCFIKLTRCDRSCEEDILEGVEIVKDRDEEIIGENICNSTLESSLSRSGSFSILNNFDEFDDLPAAEDLERSSSPVMNVYEAIAALNNTLMKASQASKLSEKNTCKSEWCKSKSELYFEYKQISEQYVINCANDDTKANLDEMTCLKSADAFNAPSLLQILSKFFQDNNHIIDRMRPISSVLKYRTPRRKRKSTSFDTSVMSKLSKLNNGKRLVQENNPHDSYDKSMTGEVKEYNSTLHNMYQDDVSKPLIMAQVHMESLKTNDVETDLISDNLQKIEAQSLKTHDVKSVTTVAQTDFVTDELQEVKQDDKNEIGSCCAADLISDNLQKYEAQSIKTHDEKSVTTVSQADFVTDDLQEVKQDDKNVTINCCAADLISENLQEICSQYIEPHDEQSVTTVAQTDFVSDELQEFKQDDDNEISSCCAVDLNSDNLQEIYSQSIEPHDEQSATTVSQADFVTDELQEVQQDDKNEMISCCAADHIPDNLQENEAQSIEPHNEKFVTTVSQTDLTDALLEVQQDDKSETISCCSDDKNMELHRNISEISQTINDVDCVNIDNLKECNDDMKIVINNITNDSDGYLNNEVQNETSTTTDDRALVGNNEITSTIEIDEPVHDCTEVSVAASSLNDNEITPYTAADENSIEQSNQPKEVITAIDVNQDDLKISEVQIEIPTTNAVELLDNHEAPSATSIDETKLEPMEMAIDKTASCDKEISDYTSAEECNSEQDSTKEITAINIVQDNVVGKIQIETATTQEDMVLLNEDDKYVVTNINKTKLEPIETAIDKTASDDKEICDYTPAEECNIEQDSVKEITAINIDRDNVVGEIHIETTQEDMVLLDEDIGYEVTNINETIEESTDLLVKTPNVSNEIYNNTAVNEGSDEKNTTQIEHIVEVKVAFDYNQEIIQTTEVQTPPTKEIMVSFDDNESSLAANIDNTSFELTEVTVASTDSNIRNNKAANESTSEQNKIQMTHPIDVATEIEIHPKSPTIGEYIEVSSASADGHNTEDFDNEIVEIAEATPQHEKPRENVVGDRIELNANSNHKVNPNEDTKETSNPIQIPNIRDHEYTDSNKLNHLLEFTEDSSDKSSDKEFTHMIPTANYNTLDIRDDNEILSNGSENVVVDLYTDEMWCDPDLFWSGIESRSQIVNSEVHEKETPIKTDMQVKSQKENDLNDSIDSVDILDKSGEDDHISTGDECRQLMSSSSLESSTLIEGIECEDPEIGTYYVFPIVSLSKSNKCDSDANDLQEVIRIIGDDSSDEDFKLNVPKITYSKEHTKSVINCSPLYEKKNRRSLKRKADMTDTKICEKRYRKGKGIDYPKSTAAAIKETAYTTQFKCLFDYFNSIKFSYSLPFHKDYINVHNVMCDWPIQSFSSNVSQTENEVDEHLFRDVETPAEPTFPNLKEESTLAEEIAAEYNETDYSYSDINETNFNMGFGEGSDRVIQNLEGGDDISKFSAATLSDVKQSQPLLLSESSNNTTNTTKDEIDKLQRHHTYMKLRDRVRSFFRKTKIELNYDWIEENKKDRDGYDASTFPFGLNVPELFEPGPVEAVVQVVQVGQLAVSAAAQNPVTCDPRVTQVSNVSPSQCSEENSPNDDPQSAIKTEYTELTTADLRLPLVHDYTQHNQSMPMESQEASNMADDNIPIETEIKSVVKIELMEELPEDNPEFNENDEHNFENNNFDNNESQNNMNNIDYSFTNVNTHVDTATDNNTNNIDVVLESAEKQHISDTFPQQKQHNGSSEKTDQIAHAMNAAGITTTSETITDTRAQALVNILSQNIRQGAVNTTTSVANTYPKTTSINAMSLQQALAQILPPPLNQTNVNENNQQTQNNSVTPQVLHIVQSKNASGNQITLVDNSQQSVISTPNGTPVLHIVQNKSNSAGPISNGTPTSQTNTFSGLSLVDAGLQQGGNQLLHIVNTGNQKNSAGQLLKRVNLLTNLTNVQGSNEQKMVQFVCKSADGKSIQLNAPHQRSMVLRLQPIETPNIQAAPTKPVDSQDISPTPNAANTVPNKETLTPQEIKSRSVYEENYAKFIQNSNTNKTTILEKATSLPKFNQAFGKQVFQDGNQKQNEINSNSLLSSVNNNNDTSECQSTDNAINLEHITQLSSPPLLLRKSPAQTSQAQNNLVQQIKQTIAPMNLQTMHGGVIYTRQIPVNIGGGQTINLITVPSTELIDDATQKQQADVKFVNQGEMEPSIIKIVPQSAPNTEVSNEDNNTHMGANENSHPPQPQPVLAQMRIKLPMLSKAPQMVSGARVVRPSFFQIQRNVIGGTNQQVYQQLVLTAAPPLGQQTIRLPQTQTTRQVKVPTENQSSTESQMSSSTLEQLREFDLVLEQVKERSTVQPNANSSSTPFSKLHTPSTDTTDGAAAASSTSGEITQQVLYSIGNNQPINVAYVNRKATISAPITSSFVRSPDSSGVADSSSSTLIQIPRTVTSDTSSSDTPAQSKPTKVSSKSKSRQRASSSNPPNTLKLNTAPPKTTAQKPLEDELTMQRILYILADYKEQVENSPDKDKPAPRRRSNPPSNPSGSSKRKKSSSSSRRPGVRDISPIHGEDTCRTMGSEDSSCGTSGDCNESCLDSHSPQDSPRKVVKKLTFDHEIPVSQPRPQPQRNLIMADGQTITVARGTAGKPATAVLMPANYILPVSMVKGGQQIAIVTNRGPKLLTVGGEGGTANALLLQRLIGPAGLKPVLARPGVRHVRLPTAALHNLQAFNLAATVQPPDSTASPVQAPTPPELVDTRANSSPWTDRPDAKPDRGSSPEGSEPWNLPSSADTHDYTYEETGRTDNMDRTVLDSISDRYSPDMEAQRIFDKMFDVDSKKSYMVDSPRCGYDIDASDCDDKAYHQVVHKKDGTSHRQHRLTHVSAAALRHKYAILEHELRLQKSLSEECEDLGVDSPSASELFPEAELLFAASPAHDHTQDHGHHSHTPQPTFLSQSGIPQPDMDDQIATDQLLSREHVRDVRDDRDHRDHGDHRDLNLGLEDVGIVTVSEDGLQATIALDQEEFARAHPNTTFHSEPTDDAEVHPFTISGIKGRHITSAIFHSNRPPGTVLMTAPQTTVISQATTDSNVHNVKYDIDNMINSLPSSHTNTINLSSVLVKDDGLTRFDNLLNDSRELHLSNTASAIVHSAGNATQVIRRVCYDDDKRDTRFLMDEPEGLIAGDDAKMIAEDSSRDATLESMADVDDDRSSPERHTELFWESNSASERSESRRPLDFSSDSDKCCKSPFDETNSTDSSGVGTHMRLDTVIKEARGIERSASGDGSSADDTHPPLRTYPPKRLYHTIENDIERSMSGKTRAGERSPGLEVRRRASGRGVVKRGCHCCSGEPAPPRPKKPRQRKPTLDFTTHN